VAFLPTKHLRTGLISPEHTPFSDFIAVHRLALALNKRLETEFHREGVAKEKQDDDHYSLKKPARIRLRYEYYVGLRSVRKS
jgi:hypothetical protein